MEKENQKKRRKLIKHVKKYNETCMCLFGEGRKEGKGRKGRKEGKGREGKEGKGREGKGREGKERKGRKE